MAGRLVGVTAILNAIGADALVFPEPIAVCARLGGSLLHQHRGLGVGQRPLGADDRSHTRGQQGRAEGERVVEAPPGDRGAAGREHRHPDLGSRVDGAESGDRLDQFLRGKPAAACEREVRSVALTDACGDRAVAGHMEDGPGGRGGEPGPHLVGGADPVGRCGAGGAPAQVPGLRVVDVADRHSLGARRRQIDFAAAGVRIADDETAAPELDRSPAGRLDHLPCRSRIGDVRDFECVQGLSPVHGTRGMPGDKRRLLHRDEDQPRHRADRADRGAGDARR